MIENPAQARDSMALILRDAWAVADWAALGLAEPPPIIWQGRGADAKPDLDGPYIIWMAKHASMPQSGFSNEIGEVKYSSVGVIVIQCKAPLLPGNGFEVAEQMAIIARNAYRGKQTPDCIWFRNARIEEVGPDAGWYLFNTFVEFDYDEVG